MYLPQPAASCLRSPPDTAPLPTLAPVVFHPSAPSPVDFVHARWKFECPLSLPAPFVEWCQSRLRFGPRRRLMAACANCRIGAQLLEHAYPATARVPLAGAPGGTASLARLYGRGSSCWLFGCHCNTLSVLADLHLALLRSLTSMLWSARALSPATKSFRPACSGLSFPLQALARMLGATFA